jgi:hypothetical protein
MKHFINLSSCVINKLHIVEIVKKPSNYTIYMSYQKFTGFMGLFTSERYIYNVCEKINKEDYDIITNWIKTIKN